MLVAICLGVSLVSQVSPYDLLLPRPVRIERRAEIAALEPISERLEAVGAPDDLAEESYRLTLASSGVSIVAPTEKGLRFGRATLAQLVALSAGKKLSAATVTDWPAMKWRGLLLDCGRNYVSLPLIRETIDFLSRYKYNVFHWHLSDYHGWRLESKRYPQLQSPIAFTRQPGRYYTQLEFKEMIAYAAARGITVVPEIDVPGHSGAFRRAFGLSKMDSEGVDEIVCELIDELCSLADAKTMPVIHLGTDEVREKAEFVPEAWYGKWARQVSSNGRTVMGWWPGHRLETSGKIIQEGWFETRAPEGPYVDARCCCYIDSFSPWSLLAQAEFNRVGGWWPKTDPAWRLGGEIQAWHDDPIEDSGDVVRNNPVFPAILLYSDMLWHDRSSHDSGFAFAPPSAGHPAFQRLVDLERRALSHRDKVLVDFPYPLQLVKQTHMLWTLSDDAGRVVKSGIPGATVYVESPRKEWGYSGFSVAPSQVAVLSADFHSDADCDAGAFIELSEFHRSGARKYGLPSEGHWNRAGATISLNGKPILPPKWNHPGAKGEDLANIPWTDECAWIRPPTPIRLKKGLNHVEIRLPKPPDDWYWSASFIPVIGSCEHPREI